MLAALAITLAGCTENGLTIDEATTYAVVVPPFATVEACREVADPLYNCEPSLVLCPGGRFQLLITDIINVGTYTIVGDQLRATLTGPGDAPADIVGTLRDDALRSDDLPFGDWHRRAPTSFEADICRDEQALDDHGPQQEAGRVTRTPAALPAVAATGHVAVAGRRVGYTSFGPDTGAPVLLCTGAGMAGSLGFAGDALAALDVRLLVVDRAGLGLSAPDPVKSLASHARDIAAVLDDLGIDTAPVVGLSQGAPFATAFAATGRASALAIVSGQDELAHPRMRPLLHADIASLIDAIAADRDGFEAAFATRVDADGLWQLVLGMSAPADREYYSQPVFAAAYRAALQQGFAQGPAGYVRDLTLALSRWPSPPEAITVPTQLWYGRHDLSPVHSPDLGATLATRFPRVARRVLDDEGGALLWTRGAEILAAVTSAAGRPR